MTLDAHFRKQYPEMMENCFDCWCPVGWVCLVTELVEDLSRLPGAVEHIRIAQIKEKFGGLRFYADFNYTGEYKWMTTALDLIDAAERASFGLCEYCGEAATKTDAIQGWVRTTCDEHRQELP